MKHMEVNPEGLADPTIGEHVNPALKAAVEVLAEGLTAVGEPEARFIVLVHMSRADEPGKTTLRIASNIEPEHVKGMLRDIGNEGQDVIPMAKAFAMVNMVCRVAKVATLTPAQFVTLSRKIDEDMSKQIIVAH